TELTTLLLSAKSQPIRVLFHACSVGAEPYSLALWWRHRVGGRADRALSIAATDIEEEFLALARRGVYPSSSLEGLKGEERSWFAPHPNGVEVPAEVRAMVEVLPPQSFVDAPAEPDYDAVFIMNALTYVTPLEQRQAITRAARAARHVVGLTAFHPDSIAADIAAAGLKPWPGAQQSIHEGWGDRLVDGPVRPESPYYSFQLPRQRPHVPDAAYRYCALFTPATAQAP
ncbi:MAG: CheR family methyltransferase, partial [Acidobacteriota bacterium]